MPITTKICDYLCIVFVIATLGYGNEASSQPQFNTKHLSKGSISLDDGFASKQKVVHFLQQSTFGPQPEQLSKLAGTSASNWFNAQLQLKPSLLLPKVIELGNKYRMDDENAYSPFYLESTSIAFWQNAITAEDQLRQRMAFALSQILVVSNGAGDELSEHPEMVASFQDILIRGAFGNYRDLLEAVTYSPAMGYYLTYLGNVKGDPDKGTVPDENYARELLQLFTIGLTALNLDGSLKLDQTGQAIEVYNNQDITGLARVFTGLDYDYERGESDDTYFNAVYAIPMVATPEEHSSKEKSFLGLTIPANTNAQTSIDLALDHIFAHPNLGTFIGKQLIQRLVSSNPSKSYVSSVATAFNLGKFTLPDGSIIGNGKRGALDATLAAILFHPEARNIATPRGGKLKEPVLRFTQWARAFSVENITPRFQPMLWDTSLVTRLSQHPYRSPSVFNFYRPGYKAPGSISAQNGLVAPELEITNASTIVGYTNFMTYYIWGFAQEADAEEFRELLEESNVDLDIDALRNSFLVNYRALSPLAHNSQALIEQLDLLLTAKQMTDSTKQHIAKVLNTLPLDDDDEEENIRIKMAVLLVMTSPDYLVQK